MLVGIQLSLSSACRRNNKIIRRYPQRKFALEPFTTRRTTMHHVTCCITPTSTPTSWIIAKGPHVSTTKNSKTPAHSVDATQFWTLERCLKTHNAPVTTPFGEHSIAQYGVSRHGTLWSEKKHVNLLDRANKSAVHSLSIFSGIEVDFHQSTGRARTYLLD